MTIDRIETIIGGGQAGLTFAGLPWLHTQQSRLLWGVGDDAAFIAGHIAVNQGMP